MVVILSRMRSDSGKNWAELKEYANFYAPKLPIKMHLETTSVEGTANKHYFSFIQPSAMRSLCHAP